MSSSGAITQTPDFRGQAIPGIMSTGGSAWLVAWIILAIASLRFKV